jgi:chaperonin GroEL (HSP60 family)
MLQDIAILTGGTVISEEQGYKLEDAARFEMLGTAEKLPSIKTIPPLLTEPEKKKILLQESTKLKPK